MPCNQSSKYAGASFRSRDDFITARLLGRGRVCEIAGGRQPFRSARARPAADVGRHHDRACNRVSESPRRIGRINIVHREYQKPPGSVEWRSMVSTRPHHAVIMFDTTLAVTAPRRVGRRSWRHNPCKESPGDSPAESPSAIHNHQQLHQVRWSENRSSAG